MESEAKAGSGSREATRDTRRQGAKGDPKGASERGVQSYGRPVCSRLRSERRVTRTGAPMSCRRSSRFWGLGCPKIFHEIEDSLGAPGPVSPMVVADFRTSLMTRSKTERNGAIREESRVGEGGWLTLEVRSFPQEPRENKAFGNEKGQPGEVDLVVLVVDGVPATNACSREG